MGVLHLATREATICKRTDARNVTGSLSLVTCRNCDKQFDAAVFEAHGEAVDARIHARHRKAAYAIGIGPFWDQLDSQVGEYPTMRLARDMIGALAYGMLEEGSLEPGADVPA